MIVNLSVKKTTVETLRELGEVENRPVGRMLDTIVEDYAARKSKEESEKKK